MRELQDILDIISGHSFRGSVKDLPSGKVCVVQMRDVDETWGVDWGSAAKTNLAGKREPHYLQPGDVLLLARGSRNHAVHLEEVPCQAVCSPHFFLLRVKPGAGLLPAFLAWQLNQAPAQQYFETAAEGSWQRSIRKPLLAALPLVVPTMARQAQVAALARLARQEAETYRQLMDNRQRMLDAIAQDVLTGKRM